MQLRIPGSMASGGASEGSSAQADQKGLDMVAVPGQNMSQSHGLTVVTFRSGGPPRSKRKGKVKAFEEL
jgi:hypothetical protein